MLCAVGIYPVKSACCDSFRRSTTTCWQRRSTKSKKSWKRREGRGSRSRASCLASLAYPLRASHRGLLAWDNLPCRRGNHLVSKHYVITSVRHSSTNTAGIQIIKLIATSHIFAWYKIQNTKFPSQKWNVVQRQRCNFEVDKELTLIPRYCSVRWASRWSIHGQTTRPQSDGQQDAESSRYTSINDLKSMDSWVNVIYCIYFRQEF